MPAEVVTSTSNRRIKDAAALLHKKHRDREGRFLVEGPRFVADLLPTGLVDEVFATPDQVDHLVDACRAADVPLTPVVEAVLDKLADSVTPQGVVAVARQRPVPLEQVLGHGFCLVLAGIADPGNAGTIVRTATAAGAAGVVFTAGSVDPWNPKAVRASAGTVARTPLVVGQELAAVIAACSRMGQRTVGLDAGALDTIDSEGVFDPPVALVLGGEAHGLPADLALDRIVAIPRYGPVESLNLAAAAAVAAYAAARVAAPRTTGGSP